MEHSTSELIGRGTRTAAILIRHSLITYIIRFIRHAGATVGLRDGSFGYYARMLDECGLLCRQRRSD